MLFPWTRNLTGPRCNLSLTQFWFILNKVKPAAFPVVDIHPNQESWGGGYLNPIKPYVI